MKHDRFLIGILVGIGLLIVVALAVFFLRQGSQDYLAEELPDGVTHNYIFALQRGDYERAYGYLADKEGKPAFAEFRSAFSYSYMDATGAGVQIVDYSIIERDDGDTEAVVTLIVNESSGGPFREVYRSDQVAVLVLQDGEWKIEQMPYPFFDWEWYQVTLKVPSPPD